MENEKKKFFLFENALTIPNLLSVIRILLIPVFAVLYYQNHLLGAVIVLAVSGLTDFFDGKIARRFNQISNLGKILDPVADKLTQMTLAVVLFLKFHQANDSLIKAFSWVFLVFVAKELLMVCFGLFMLIVGLRPGAAEIYGKVATFVFYFVMIVVFLFGPEIGALNSILVLPNIVMMILVVISAILTLVALSSYIPGVYRQVKYRRQEIRKGTWDKKNNKILSGEIK
ncbi:MAG: CDP-alcohol phosphatidyltransferase family protein [Clostridia bacterium]|nr:CDP-alcohol phosphatidyltransferase family protein [Clostridia bacterium]